ncbi:unnamed protein product [Cladocopium goreaui]|uniref:Uncharacterized protein n=1 Tax=Cladocopium goreaui TaxID=2562237 RepID=A0A9P1C3I8_9DINO|nr:unnamed protein product [Cladocopium goreaui]
MGKRRQPSSSVADQKKGLQADSEGSGSDDTLSSDDPSQTSEPEGPEPEGHVESEDALTQVQQGIGGVSDSRCMEEKQSDIDQAGKERSADSDSNGKADEVSRELHSKIRQLAAAESWPNGPDSPHGLFLWPEWNSARLLDVSSMNLKKERVERLLYLLSLDIEIHECYAGTGNGAVTLHRQLDALRMECQKHAVSCGLSIPTFGKVVTATSCDIDPISRSVLKSLPEARARVKLSRRQASQHVQMWWG